MNKEIYAKLDCIIKRSTEKSFLITTDDFEEWVPRSCCMNGHKDFSDGEEILLYLAQWKYNELIGNS